MARSLDITIGAAADLGDLDRVSWDGGPAFYEQFALADAAGWSDDTFFPIAVFLSEPGHADEFLDVGINTMMGINHVPPMSTATGTGMFVMCQSPISHPVGEWTAGEVGSDPNVVGWLVADECEMGLGGCSAGDEYDRLALFQSWCDDITALDDGRFLFANFGNGVLRTFWAPNTMDDFVQSVHVACVDKYAYTSSHVQEIIPVSPDWPSGVDPQCAAAYGWQARQMRDFDDPDDRLPVWVTIEPKKPYLTDEDATIITHAQMEGAIWSAITNEARGLSYFQHNGFYPPHVPVTDPNTGATPTHETYPLVDGPATYADAAQSVNAKIAALAPVINTQSYAWDFDAAGMDTMLKAKDGYAYVFASVGLGGTTGSKTFTLPPGVDGSTAEVLNEARSVDVTAGEFTDSFAAEYTHHCYKVAI